MDRAGSGRDLEGKTGSIPAREPRPAGIWIALYSRGKIQLEFLPHIPLIFHKDFQKPDSQPESQTLWAGSEKQNITKQPTTPPLPPRRASKRAETDVRASGAYVLTMRKRTARPRPSAPPARRAH